MRETPIDLDRLQELLDRSAAGGGAHLRSIFTDEQRPTATELTEALDDIFEMHLATLAGDGSPLVAPIDALLYRGEVWFGLPGASIRARLLRRDPRVSASFVAGDFGLIVHGAAVEVGEDEPRAKAFEQVVLERYVARYGPAFLEWRERQRAKEQPGAGYLGFIEPRVLFAKR